MEGFGLKSLSAWLIQKIEEWIEREDRQEVGITQEGLGLFEKELVEIETDGCFWVKIHENWRQ